MHNPQGDGNSLRRPNRRDFLGMMGVALGGVVLSSCGSSSRVFNVNGSSSGLNLNNNLIALPNGYNFQTALSLSDISAETRAAGDILSLTPIVMLNDQGHVVFYASYSGGFGVYQSDVSRAQGSSLTRQLASSIRPVLLTGNQTADGRTVGRITSIDLNNQGSIGMTVQSDAGSANDSTDPSAVSGDPKQWAEGVYLEKDGSGTVAPLLAAEDSVPGRSGQFSGLFGDLDVGDNDNILVSGYYTDPDAGDSKQGVFLVPNGSESGAQVVVSTGDPVPGSSQAVSSIGLIDASADGLYAVQALGTDETVEEGEETRAVAHRSASSTGHFVAVNRYGQNFQQATIYAASQNIRSTRAQGAAPSGEIYLGPRSGDDKVAIITHTSPTTQVLTLNGTTITQTGANTPNGKAIESFFAPVVGRNGILYYQAITEQGMELIASNGKQSRTILAHGQVINGKTINTIALGFSTDQVNAAGEMVVYAEFSTGEVVILHGEPV